MRRLSTHPHHFRPVINRVQTSLLMTETRTLVLIPARLAATRLPCKPLLDVAGLPTLVEVLPRPQGARISRRAGGTETPRAAGPATWHGGRGGGARSAR